jgi:hypothetical protein
VGLERARRRAGVLALALILAAWTGALARLLWHDPLAANDCAVLLAQASFADGNSYLPNLLLRSWGDAAPGLWARLATWALLALAAGVFVAPAARARAGNSPGRLLAGLCTLLMTLALGLEHWPTARQSARFDSLRLDAGTVLLVRSGGSIDGDTLVASPGSVELLVRAAGPVPAIELLGAGANPDGSAALVLSVEPLASLEGRRGNRETLGLARLSARAELRLRARLPG